MNFYTSVIKKYVTFAGRASRTEYWYFTLFNMLIMAILAIFIGVINSKSDPEKLENLTFEDTDSITVLLMSALILYMLFTFLPALSVTIRRLHDSGKSGWWYWIVLIPYIGGLILFVLLLLKSSEEKENQYGPNPKLAAITGGYIGSKQQIPVTEHIDNINMSNGILKSANPLYPDIQLSHDPIKLGRNNDNNIVINNQYISGEHVSILTKFNEAKNTDIVIIDLNSTNGTYVNGYKLKVFEEYTIHNNDYIVLGSEEVSYNLLRSAQLV